ATTYNNYGDLLMEKHEFAKARDMYAKALGAWQDARDDKRSRMAFAMSKLAAAYNVNGDSVRAEALLKQAIVMLRKPGIPESVDLATSLDSLGKIYTYQRHYQQAEPLFQESIAVAKRVMGERDVAYAIGLENLATMHRLSGNSARSQPLLTKAIAIFEETLGPRHPYLAMAWSERGLIALEEGNPAIALTYLQRAYDISMEAFGPSHLRTIFAKGNLALGYVQAAKLDTAKHICDEVLPVERGSPNITPDEFVRTLVNCAELSMKLRETKAAEGYFREAVALWRGLASQHGPSFGAALLGYSRALKASHNPEAREVEKEAKSFLENNRR
ncbi:MAG: tetratricopeptide repeat protein, partial [Bryobacteraceae bacterium]